MRIDFGKVITAEDKAEAEKQMADEEARAAATAYLAATDWLEFWAGRDGPAVPEDVKAARAAARLCIGS